MPQRGSVLPVLLVLLVIAGGFLGFKYVNLQRSGQVSPLLSLPSPTPAVKIYSDKDLGFQFEYPGQDFEVIPDSEEAYFKVTATDHRKNFSGYVGYKPPEFIKGLMMKKPDTKIGSDYNSVPLVLWVFDNPNKLSIDSWFDKYWYYPFVWGIFAQPGKGHIYPNIEATISGQMAKSVIVSYQPGKPEFTYVSNGDKMFLFRVIKGSDEKAVNQALQTFKFTK